MGYFTWYLSWIDISICGSLFKRRALGRRGPDLATMGLSPSLWQPQKGFYNPTRRDVNVEKPGQLWRTMLFATALVGLQRRERYRATLRHPVPEVQQIRYIHNVFYTYCTSVHTHILHKERHKSNPYRCTSCFQLWEENMQSKLVMEADVRFLWGKSGRHQGLMVRYYHNT